jgi:hypothetical protein
MKNRSSWLLLLLYGFCVAACGEKQCLVKTITKTKQNSGIQTTKNRCKDDKIISEQELSGTSDGKLIANGYFREYFDNGTLHSVSFFKNNKQDSIAIRYYENGNKELEFYWENGKQVGFQNQFYPDGRYKLRNYFDNNSSIIFKAIYNSNGQIDSLEGTPYNIVFNKIPNSLKLGEEFTIVNEVITLENVETFFNLKFIDPHNKTLVDKTLNQFLISKNLRFVPVIYSPKEKGKYQYIVTVKLIDKANSKTLKEHSTNFSLIVR